MSFSNERPYLVLFCLSFIFLFVSFANAQDLQTIKEQMLKRKPTIDSLKDKGIVGEGIDGYLHIRQSDNDAKSLINAENTDRRAVNGIIAKKEGTTIENVSKKVAVKLLQASKPGHWVQKGDGSWHKK